MLKSTPAPKAHVAKSLESAPKQIKRTPPRKTKPQPKVISRQVFNDFASI
ncbi:hypothetical protein [Roseovarius sp. Pro17]|nr:hypothetical protein [Roseovarius sp. Pro17]